MTCLSLQFMCSCFVYKLNDLTRCISVVVMAEFAAGRIRVDGSVHLQDGDNCTIIQCSTVPRCILALRKPNPAAVAVVRQYEISRKFVRSRMNKPQPRPNSELWAVNDQRFPTAIMISGGTSIRV